MSKTTIKKLLQSMTKAEIIEMVVDVKFFLFRLTNIYA